MSYRSDRPWEYADEAAETAPTKRVLMRVCAVTAVAAWLMALVLLVGPVPLWSTSLDSAEQASYYRDHCESMGDVHSHWFLSTGLESSTCHRLAQGQMRYALLLILASIPATAVWVRLSTKPRSYPKPHS
ncbi:MAG: hypothetical protein M0026_16685 [Nocardiopsaceae bacterium]|nr:hypothetical protein [Nocardiopsaceae bacterium]